MRTPLLYPQSFKGVIFDWDGVIAETRLNFQPIRDRFFGGARVPLLESARKLPEAERDVLMAAICEEELRGAAASTPVDGARELGFDGDDIASFCFLSEFGTVDGIRIGGPGCVGTVPEYRRRGIGSAMVRRAAPILRDDGCHISWIHYTHIPRWYMDMGYVPVVRWGKDGIVHKEVGDLGNFG